MLLEKNMEDKLRMSLIGVCMIPFLLLSCGGDEKIDHNTPQEFLRFLSTVDSVQDITIEGKDIHVRILLDSSDVGCDEEWHFKNLRIILAISSNTKWRNYIDSNNYNLYLQRAQDFDHGDFSYLSAYHAADIMAMRIHKPELIDKEIEYVMENFSCAEYRELYLILNTFKSDSIFVSGDTCFSQLFINCRTKENSRSCEDIEKIRSMSSRAVLNTTRPVVVSLNRHLIELEALQQSKP
jgi:hypothetical protein